MQLNTNYFNILPDGVILDILSQSDVRSTLNIAQTCKKLKLLSENDLLWKGFAKRDLNTKEKLTIRITWKKSYQYEVEKSEVLRGSLINRMMLGDQSEESSEES